MYNYFAYLLNFYSEKFEGAEDVFNEIADEYNELLRSEITSLEHIVNYRKSIGLNFDDVAYFMIQNPFGTWALRAKKQFKEDIELASKLEMSSLLRELLFVRNRLGKVKNEDIIEFLKQTHIEIVEKKAKEKFNYEFAKISDWFDKYKDITLMISLMPKLKIPENQSIIPPVIQERINITNTNLASLEKINDQLEIEHGDDIDFEVIKILDGINVSELRDKVERVSLEINAINNELKQI